MILVSLKTRRRNGWILMIEGENKIVRGSETGRKSCKAVSVREFAR